MSWGNDLNKFLMRNGKKNLRSLNSQRRLAQAGTLGLDLVQMNLIQLVFTNTYVDHQLLRSIISQIESLQKQHAAIKDKIEKRRKRREERRRNSKKHKKRHSKKSRGWSSDDDIKQLTLDQIPTLSTAELQVISDAINALEPDKMPHIVRIIKEGLPNLVYLI